MCIPTAILDPNRPLVSGRRDGKVQTFADLRFGSAEPTAHDHRGHSHHPGSAKSQKLPRAVNTGRCQRVIEDADLGEQSGLIPIEMLVGDFASLELDDTG